MLELIALQAVEMEVSGIKKEPGISNRTRNALLRSLRCLGGTRLRAANRFRQVDLIESMPSWCPSRSAGMTLQIVPWHGLLRHNVEVQLISEVASCHVERPCSTGFRGGAAAGYEGHHYGEAGPGHLRIGCWPKTEAAVAVCGLASPSRRRWPDQT